MTSPKDEVFSTPELLESILVHLPIQELLVNTQRVSQSWNTVIKSSPALQRKLFFQSRPTSSTEEYDFNPILSKRFYRWIPDESEHSFFSCIPPPIDWNNTHYCNDCEGDKDHWVRMDQRNQKKRDAYARKEASWRRMLPIQPAYKTFEVELEVRHDLGKTKSVGRVEFPDGVRMGTLYDYSQKTVQDPMSSFGVRLHHPWEDEDGEGKGKVTMFVWASTLPSAIDSDSEDGYSATENAIWQVGRDICGVLYPSLGYEELYIKFEFVSHELNEAGNQRLTEWIIAHSGWSARLGG